MAAAKMPPLSSLAPTSRGKAAKRSSACTRQSVTLPKIVEQRNISEDSSILLSPEKYSSTVRSSNQDITEVTLEKKTTCPVQTINVEKDVATPGDATTSQKASSKKREKYLKMRLGLASRKRPSTATLQDPPELFLTISNISPARTTAAQPPTKLTHFKNYQNKDFPLLSGSKTEQTTQSSGLKMADLCIGIQETWKTTSSEPPQKTRVKQSLQGHVASAKRKSKLEDKPPSSHFFTPHSSLDIAGSSTVHASRAGSRLGKNSLDEFLKIAGSNSSSFPIVKPKLASDKVLNPREGIQIHLSPLTSQQNQLLGLKGFVRDPVRNQNGVKRFSSRLDTRRSKGVGLENPENPSRRQSQRAPYNLKEAHNSDVPIHLPSNPFDEAYQIFTYVAL